MKNYDRHANWVLICVFSLLLSSGLKGQADDLQSALRESYVAEAKGNYTDALASILFETQRDQRNYFLQMRTGYLNMLLLKYDASLRAYEAADQLEPHGIEAAVGALKAAMMLGQWTTAESWAANILNKDPQNYTALSRLAYAYFSRKDYAKAAEKYEQVLELYPSDLDMKNGLAWSCFYLGNKPKAKTLFGEVLAVSPDNASARQGWAAVQK